MASQQPELPFRVFDAEDDILFVERRLPHWSQPGTLCFITFRTWDSMPAAVLEHWIRERDEWLRTQGIIIRGQDANTGDADHSRNQLDSLEPRLRREFHAIFSRRWHGELDQCHGDCLLRQPELAGIVAKSLTHFDGQRYDLTDFVVMPNHVHLIAVFPDAPADADPVYFLEALHRDANQSPSEPSRATILAAGRV